MLDIRKLKMLAELDDLGTIAAVARSLHLTAPGISMQLAALEREVGVPLTERHGRRVLVTPAGKILAQHARDIGDRLTVAEMEVAALRDGGAGRYRIAAFPTAARSFVAEAWRSLLASPELGVSMTLTELEPSVALPALAAGEVELAVAHSYSNLPALETPGLVAVPLARERVRLAVRDDGTAPEPADLSGFARHDWIVPQPEWSCHEMVQRACGRAGFEPRAVATAMDFSVQLALVAAGAGVALIPQLGAENVPDGVTLLELAEPVYRYDVAVTRASSAADAGLQRLRDLLTASAAGLPALR